MIDDVGGMDNPHSQDMLFQSCETTRIQHLHHLMFRQHTCSKWAQQDVFNASLVGATGPCGFPNLPKVCTARAVAKAPTSQDQATTCEAENACNKSACGVLGKHKLISSPFGSRHGVLHHFRGLRVFKALLGVTRGHSRPLNELSSPWQEGCLWESHAERWCVDALTLVFAWLMMVPTEDMMDGGIHHVKKPQLWHQNCHCHCHCLLSHIKIFTPEPNVHRCRSQKLHTSCVQEGPTLQSRQQAFLLQNQMISDVTWL